MHTRLWVQSIRKYGLKNLTNWTCLALFFINLLRREGDNGLGVLIIFYLIIKLIKIPSHQQWPIVRLAHFIFFMTNRLIFIREKYISKRDGWQLFSNFICGRGVCVLDGIVNECYCVIILTMKIEKPMEWW